MGYTKAQIEKLGIRPRERKARPDGVCGLLPCEQKEVKAVAKAMSESDELFQTFRLIPFEEGYACQLRNRFEKWVYDEVENLWYDIGRPEFDEYGEWSCPEGGWWPYLNHPYLDVSRLRVGSAMIDMDEVFTTLYHMLQEKVKGYRMCPGMALYRIVSRLIIVDDKMSREGPKVSAKEKEKLEKERKKLRDNIIDLVRDYPTDVTRNIPDREYYS